MPSPSLRAALLAAAALPALHAQAVPAQNMVVIRRVQTFGSAATAYSWTIFQNGVAVQNNPQGMPLNVPADKRLVITGIRYMLNGSYGLEMNLGPVYLGNVNPQLTYSGVRTPAWGTSALVQGADNWNPGLSFAPGSQVDLKVTKLVVGSSDTFVQFWMYGYFEP